MEDSILKLGLSPRFLHRDQKSFGIRSKTIQYLEQSIAHWIASHNALVFMVPSLAQHSKLKSSDLNVNHYASALDALVLQGGVDISPQIYGEEPMDNLSEDCDPIRDRYELELIHAFMQAGKPILGICRGHQLINIYFGGTLYQDIKHQVNNNFVNHLDNHSYDKNAHTIQIQPGSLLEQLHGKQSGRVISIHHQAIKELGDGLEIEALSEDKVIEAVRWNGDNFVYGLQWHPEFHKDGQDHLSNEPIMDYFLQKAREQKKS